MTKLTFYASPSISIDFYWIVVGGIKEHVILKFNSIHTSDWTMKKKIIQIHNEKNIPLYHWSQLPRHNP